MSVQVRERQQTELEQLKTVLGNAHITLRDVRRILLPSDPWKAARGLWRGRKQLAEHAAKALRKEWNRY